MIAATPRLPAMNEVHNTGAVTLESIVARKPYITYLVATGRVPEDRRHDSASARPKG